MKKYLAILLSFVVVLYITTNFGPPNTSTKAADGGYFKYSSSAIAITADGSKVLAVNPDSGSLSIITLGNPPLVTEITVCADPRTVAVDPSDNLAFVACRGEDAVGVVDILSGTVSGIIPTAAHPYGVVVSPDGAQMFVSEQGSDQISSFDLGTFQKIATYPTLDRPSGLALTPDGRSLFVTHLYNNRITKIHLGPKAYLPVLATSPTDLQNTNPNNSPNLNFLILNPIVLFPSSNLLQSIIISQDGSTAYLPHTRSNSTNRALTVDSTVFPTVSLVDVDENQHLIGQQLDLATLDPPAVGLPFDGALTPEEDELWVVNAASNDVTVIDLVGRTLAAHIEVGANPRGIVLAPNGTAAYVNNTLSGTVSIINTETYSVTEEIAITTIPLPANLLLGKQLFHTSDDPRMGRDQWMSCNSCHFDGEHDGRTWFLGFAGPRNTPSLQGMSATVPLRWSGEWDEAQDSEFAIRMDSFGAGLVDGAMNCSLNPPDCVNHPPHAGLSPELDALADYLNSLTVSISPTHRNGEPLTTAEQNGQEHFTTLGCAECHAPPTYSDGLAHDVGTVTGDERIGPAYNTPSLLGLYDSAPYFHDGSADALYAAVTRDAPGGEHDVTDTLNSEEIDALIAFLMALPFE